MGAAKGFCRASLGGYSSVVSVFGSTRSDFPQRRWRIRLMIATSGLAIMFALLPLLLEQFGLQGRMLWSASGVLLALGLFLQLGITFRWMPSTYRNSYFLNPPAILLLFSSVLAGMSLLTVAGTGGEQLSRAFYLMILIYLLFLTGDHFMRIVLAELPIR